MRSDFNETPSKIPKAFKYSSISNDFRPLDHCVILAVPTIGESSIRASP